MPVFTELMTKMSLPQLQESDVRFMENLKAFLEPLYSLTKQSSTTVNLPPQAPFPNRKRRPMKPMISKEDNFVPKRRCFEQKH
ncbi:unnamed protein product [Cylicocyclus nassatus]|uniref:Uncharacterized protein n=1 Tax=Cylicocyclus nassatus TaxID=53992 RepID=A0AA36DMV1_CYLNA|nr:unnamed protein product [Cylicocyclus nassatus]